VRGRRSSLISVGGSSAISLDCSNGSRKKKLAFLKVGQLQRICSEQISMTQRGENNLLNI